jgi:hypothetical protein
MVPGISMSRCLSNFKLIKKVRYILQEAHNMYPKDENRTELTNCKIYERT